ncbi:hypothetical protein [Streptomyces decoyicus]|uniref:hypothetical protein n=1 Tax=Streptomyces decoyicus TaxID=249567 RepID=UPI003863127D|nr:hypothetical protein OG532_18085 [Streptomyces decoyicus]
MNLHIAPLNGLIFGIGCVVGYLVFRRTAANAQPLPGDLPAAIAAAASTIVVLAFLFGLGDGKASKPEETRPAPTPTVQDTTVVEQSPRP